MRITKSSQEKNKKKNYKKVLQRAKRKIKGITLIALVVTIIVLLILAGVALNLTIGDNGLFKRAQNAVEVWDKAGEKEKISLAMAAAQIDNRDSSSLKEKLEIELLKAGIKSIAVNKEDGTMDVILLDSKKIYKINADGSIDDTNSDFDIIFVSPKSQDEDRNKNVIGIGTNGEPVDMDLWEYTLMKDEKYVLNDAQYIDENVDDKNLQRSPGYIGEIQNGSIIGKIPQYISRDNGKTYTEVTSLRDTFRTLEDLESMAEIPTTVQSMRATYESCLKLKNVVHIPESVKNLAWCFSMCRTLEKMPKIEEGCENMYGTFSSCNKLKNAEKIPETVATMGWCFNDCNELLNAPEIPYNVTNLEACFGSCWEMKNAPTFISKNVTNMERTFKNCQRIEGIMIIEANPTTYQDVFTGTAVYSDGDFFVKGNEQILQLMIDSSSYNKVKILSE